MPSAEAVKRLAFVTVFPTAIFLATFVVTFGAIWATTKIV